MADVSKQGAIGDAASPRDIETDRNGAGTAVGVPHPENRPEGQSVPAMDFSGMELDDYDDDKQGGAPITELPPDQDVGESFSEIVDVGETPDEHRKRAVTPNGEDEAPPASPMVDNQVGQPERFHNPRKPG